MVTCPTCGQPVPENQRFCGNCGTDVQAAAAYRAREGTGANDISQDPAYSYDTSAYQEGLPPSVRRGVSRTVLVLLVAAVALLCLCCGLILGAGAIYLLTAPASSAPVPTPASLNFLFQI